MNKNLYIVSPKLNDWVGKAEFIPHMQFPWNHISVAKKIDTKFQMLVQWKRLKEISLDYFRSTSPIVSERFAAICQEQQVNCQLVPLDILLNGNPLGNKFYFLLLNKFISIVDASKTPHVREMTRDGKGYQINKFFPDIPQYDMLENVVLNDSERPPFFMAPEIGNKRVCTQAFKECVERNKMNGLEFKVIDSSFKYEALGYGAIRDRER